MNFRALGLQALNSPAAAGGFVLQPIMQSALSTLPKLILIRLQQKPTPVLRPRCALRMGIAQRLIARLKRITIGHPLALRRGCCRQLTTQRPRVKVGIRFFIGEFYDRAAHTHLTV